MPSDIQHPETCSNCKKETYEFEKHCHICGHDRWQDRDGDPHRTIISLTKTGSHCPSQWEGQLANGQQAYIRCRHDRLTVGVGDTLKDAVRSEPVLEADTDVYYTRDLEAFLRERGWTFDV